MCMAGVDTRRSMCTARVDTGGLMCTAGVDTGGLMCTAGVDTGGLMCTYGWGGHLWSVVLASDQLQSYLCVRPLSQDLRPMIASVQ